MKYKNSLYSLIGNICKLIAIKARSLYEHLAIMRRVVNVASFLTAITILNVTSAGKVYSQSALLPEGERETVILREMELGRFGAALRESTTFYSSKDDLDKIPPHSLYHMIFVRLLSNDQAYRAQFTKEDWDLIEALPSHRDASLFEPQIISMKSTCYALSEAGKLNLSFEQSLQLYVDTARSGETLLDEHYLTAYAQLSDQGKGVFNTIKEGARGTNSIVYSTTDFEVAARQHPEVAKEHMNARCEQTINIETDMLLEGIRLKDDIEVRNWGE